MLSVMLPKLRAMPSMELQTLYNTFKIQNATN
jgi:hypothetical protein